MWRNALRDPGATGMAGDLPNLHNRPGDLPFYSALVVVEALVALLILRPWTYHHHWRRSAFAALCFVPWFLVNFMVLIHSGGIMVIHTLWVLALDVGLAVAAAVSGTGAATHRARSRSELPNER